MVPEVQHALDQPSDCDGDDTIAGPCGPHGHDDQCEEQHADVADEVFVVGAALGGNPTAAKRKIVEERSGEEGCLQRRQRHEQGDATKCAASDSVVAHGLLLDING